MKSFWLLLVFFALHEIAIASPTQIELNRNLQSCQHGFSSCRKDWLTASQKQAVRQAELHRNNQACQNGFHSCRKDWLTAGQKQAARQAELHRNNQACQNGFSNSQLEKYER